MFSLGSDAPTQTTPSSRLESLVSGSNTMLTEAYWHPNPTRNALGLFAGNDVSPIAGNLVDLESEFRGITRDLSRDPSKKSGAWMAPPSNYKSEGSWGQLGTAAQQEVQGPKDAIMTPFGYQGSAPPPTIYFAERETGKLRGIVTAPRHLPTRQYVSYPGVPTPAPLVVETHGAPWRF